MLNIMSNYGEEVVTALGSEVDRLEKEIQELVPGIQHVDIEAHNPTPTDPSLWSNKETRLIQGRIIDTFFCSILLAWRNASHK